MKKQVKRVSLIFVLTFLLLFLTSCDPINNLINNLTSGFGESSDVEEEKFVKITFDYEIDGYLDFSLSIKKGEKIYEPINPVVKGYTFKGWYKEEEMELPYNFKTPVIEDLRIIAHWEEANIEPPKKENLTVTYNYNMPNVNITVIEISEESKTIEPLSPLRAGYEFVGWFTKNDEKFDFDEVLIDDLTLIAKWEEKEDVPIIKEDISVLFKFNNDFNNIEIKIPYGAKVIEPKKPTKEGFTFVGWFVNENDVFNFQTNIIKDLTLIAKWQEGDDEPVKPVTEDVKIKFNFNAPHFNDAEIKMKKGSKPIEPKPIEQEGFLFVGWFTDLSETVPFDFNQPINEDIGLIAKWKSVSYTPVYIDVTFIYYDEDDEVNMFIVNVEKDFAMEEPLSPTKKYYNFLGWYKEDSEEAFDFTETINDSYVFIGKWELKDEKVRVSFMKSESELLTAVMVSLGSLVTPVEVEADSLNIFIGWKDHEGNFFDFSQPIFSKTILYATYYPSYLDAVNEISKNVMRGNVTIYKYLYNSNPRFGNPEPIHKSQGSGAIIKKDSNDFYVLTNSHVTTTYYKTDDEVVTNAPYAVYEIEDYLGKIYIGTLIIDGEDKEKSNVDHDLAILKFTINPLDDNNNLKAIPIANEFDTNHILAIVGQPHGQKNTITFGAYLETGNRMIKGITETKRYEAVTISAPGASGSSGSMVINQNHEIIGTVFAGASETGFVDSTYMIIVPFSYILLIMAELNDHLVMANMVTIQSMMNLDLRVCY